MPTRVDHPARLEFLRRAAFELVPVDLMRLAAREVTTRRRRGRLTRRSDDPREFVRNLDAHDAGG
jgi:hypothetical protein